MLRRAQPYIQLTRLNKPIGILLLLWPTLWALWLAAKGTPSLRLLSIFILGVILMRSAGCIINDILDRSFDRHVERSQHRPITSGQITVKRALILFFVLMSLAFLLVLHLNTLCLWLAIIAAVLTCCYPLMKRYIVLAQGFLGITFAWGIPMAYAATNATLPTECWLLYLANACWVIAYDTLYAMTDKVDDLKIGLHSSAIFFGRFDRAIIACLHGISLSLLSTIAYLNNLAWPMYAGIFVAALLALYQQHLIRSRQPALCFRAFLNNHWLGFAVFLGLLFSL